MNTTNKESLLIVAVNIHIVGGAERVACNMANHYCNKGWRIGILSFNTKQDSVIFNLSDQVMRHYLNVTTSNKLLQKVQVFFRLKNFLKKNRYTYVMGIGSFSSTMLGFCAKEKNGAYFIGTEHSHYYNAPKIWNYLRKYSYSKLEAITVLTNNDYPILKEINKNTFVIPNALIQMPEIYTTNKEHRFLAIGRIDGGKQFSQMIEVFNEFVKKNDDWTLSVVGDGVLREALEEQVKRCGLEKKVEIKHFTNEVEKEYLSSSVLLSTSKFEGLPMTMIEAQSYGLPIISYDCKTGPADIIIDSQNGFLIKTNDAQTMLKKMLLLADNEDLRLRMSENAIKDSYRFSPEAIYKKWDTLFGLLKNNKTSFDR